MKKIAPAFGRKTELLAPTTPVGEGPEACNGHPMQVFDLNVAGLVKLDTVRKIVSLAGEVVGHLGPDGHVLHLHTDHAWLALLVIRESRSFQARRDEDLGEVSAYFIHRYWMAGDFKLVHDLGVSAVDFWAFLSGHEQMERAGR